MLKQFNTSIEDLLLTSILIALPLSIEATNYIIITLVAYLLVSMRRHGRLTIFAKSKWELIASNLAPLVFIILSLSYSNDWYEGLKGIEKYLPLLAFPFVFVLARSRQDKAFFTRVFAMVVITLVAVCLAFALFNFFFTPAEAQLAVGDSYSQIVSRWNALSNTSLMQPFNINPIYMALYVSFAVFVFALDFPLPKKLRAIIVVVLISFQFLVSSRIGLLALFASVVVYALLNREKVSQYSRIIVLALVLIAAVSTILILYNPIVKKRLIVDLNKFELPEEVSGWNGINIRHAIWDCSIELIGKSPLLGYGVGSQYKVRENCYKNYSFYGPFGEHLNCHNQFLEYLLIGGLILVALFIIQLITTLFDGLKKNDQLQTIFLILFAMTCLGESLLETHKGIVFFAFFNSLFVFHNSARNIQASPAKVIHKNSNDKEESGQLH